MQLTPSRQEIDHRTIKLIIGVIAISLGSITSYFARQDAGVFITSISESYHVGRWAQSFFVGFLFAIAALLLAYNGLTLREMVLSKLACLAAVGVALFPCQCGRLPSASGYVHAAAATIMFVILAGFCHIFYRRARSKANPQANMRATIYAVCGVAIIASILVIAVDRFFGGMVSSALTSEASMAQD